MLLDREEVRKILNDMDMSESDMQELVVRLEALVLMMCDKLTAGGVE